MNLNKFKENIIIQGWFGDLQTLMEAFCCYCCWFYTFLPAFY